jgi:hypothetical protein
MEYTYFYRVYQYTYFYRVYHRRLHVIAGNILQYAILIFREQQKSAGKPHLLDLALTLPGLGESLEVRAKEKATGWH